MYILVAWCFYTRRDRYSGDYPTWLNWLFETDIPFFKVNQPETIIEHLDLQPGMVVLDVGCGLGRLSIPVASKVGPTGEVVAMDIHTWALHRTQKKAEIANLTNIKFLHARIGEKKLEHNKFDRALLVSVLGVTFNAKAVMQEIFDALKPGGILSVNESFFSRHSSDRTTVLLFANQVGFREKNRFGNCFAFTLNLEKPDSARGSEYLTKES